jgi:hypothetical protein
MGAWSTTTKTNAAAAVLALFDGGAGAAKMKFYDGATLIATITLNDPSFSNSSGVLMMLGTPKSAASGNSGTIDSYTITDSNDVVIRSGGVGTSGSGKNVILSTVDITAPQSVQIDSCSITILPDDAG